MNKPKVLMIHADHWPALSCLSDEQLGRLLRHLCTWFFDDSGDDRKEELLVDSDIRPSFLFMRAQINLDTKKYQQKCEKRRDAANKRWSLNANDANAFFACNKNENNNKNNNENNNENKSKNNNNNSSKAAIDINNSNGEAVNDAAAADFSSFLERMRKGFLPWFNKTLDEHDSKIPRVKIITEERARRIKAIIDSYGQAAFEQTIRIAAGAAFLNGRGEKNKFVATLAWIIDPSHFIDVYEGKYCV